MVDFLYWLMETPLALLGGVLGLLALVGVLIWLIRRGRNPALPVIPRTEAAPAVHGMEVPKLVFATDEELAAGASAIVPPEVSASPAISPASQSPSPVAAVPTPQAPPPQYRLRSQMIKDAFQGPIPKVPVSGKFRLAAVMIGITMIILPLVYLAIVAFSGYAVYYHATVNYDVIMGDNPNRVTWVIYVVPLVVLTILFLFLLRPLIIGMPRHMKPRSLDPQTEPLLVCFVEQVCKAVGAPVPREIRIDCQVNASAGLRNGLWSLFSTNDLVLTIGLPLVANMNTREFAGLLAHEFGHFKQGNSVAMRYITHRVNQWFMRVVYERAPEDLDDDAQPDAGVAIIVWITSLLIALTRSILKVLMLVAHMLSCFLSRQQEYDADRYAASVAGSKVYGNMLAQAPILDVAEHETYKSLRNSFRKFALARDLANLIRTTRNTLGEQIQVNIINKALAANTGKYDTHPALRDRLQAIADWDAPGIVELDRPATELFNNFEDLSAETTLEYYRMIVGPLVTAESLLPNDQFADRFGSATTGMISVAGMR